MGCLRCLPENAQITEDDGHPPFKTCAQALVYQAEEVDCIYRDRRIIVTGMMGLLLSSAFAYSAQ